MLGHLHLQDEATAIYISSGAGEQQSSKQTPLVFSLPTLPN
jgi:hypothetical protein